MKLSAENRRANFKTQTAAIQRVLVVSAATSKCHVRTAVNSTQPTASTATRSHRPPPSYIVKQQANHGNSPNVLGPLFPGLRAKAKDNSRITQHDALENEAGSSFSV